MPKAVKVCRVCGKTYESCKSIRTGSKVFNWREVACSPECGEKYLELILESRSEEETPADDFVIEFEAEDEDEDEDLDMDSEEFEFEFDF